jgi:hypothetical protein
MCDDIGRSFEKWSPVAAATAPACRPLRGRRRSVSGTVTAKRPEGRPPWQPTDPQRRIVKEMVANGIPFQSKPWVSTGSCLMPDLRGTVDQGLIKARRL